VYVLVKSMRGAEWLPYLARQKRVCTRVYGYRRKRIKFNAPLQRRADHVSHETLFICFWSFGTLLLLFLFLWRWGHGLEPSRGATCPCEGVDTVWSSHRARNLSLWRWGHSLEPSRGSTCPCECGGTVWSPHGAQLVLVKVGTQFGARNLFLWKWEHMILTINSDCFPKQH
jgi:hypothetical protein